MDWTLFSSHVLWIHALILAVTLTMAYLLQIFNSRQERRQATQRWERQRDAGWADRPRLSARGVSATRFYFTKDPM